MKKIFLSLGIVLLAGAGCASSMSVNTTPGNNSTPAPTTQPAASVYENAYLKLSVPAGWKAQMVNDNQAAVNLTKGKWILYINTQAQQASGAEGGRFAEIGMGAPSVDLVVTEQPSECGQTTRQDAFMNFTRFTRVDYSMNATDAKDWCAAPINGKTVWFFSYLTSPNNGYFNYYHPTDTDPGKALVVTMAYDAKTVNDLPVVGSAELNVALQEMTDIAATLEIKQK